MLLLWLGPLCHATCLQVHRGFLTSFNDVVQQTNDGGYDSMTAVRDELFGKGVLPDRCGRNELLVLVKRRLAGLAHNMLT